MNVVSGSNKDPLNSRQCLGAARYSEGDLSLYLFSRNVNDIKNLARKMETQRCDANLQCRWLYLHRCLLKYLGCCMISWKTSRVRSKRSKPTSS